MKLTHIRFAITTILVGLSSGLLGMLLALLLHHIQHLAYGYSLDSESFLAGVSHASTERRVFILILCGVIAGVGWWFLYRFGKPLVAVKDAVTLKKVMPPLATTIHALLQIVTIALGSPLGREVAPREASAVFAQRLAVKMKLSVKDSQIMVACGAGAGLAAVYNVPLGGAIFTLEVLLGTFHWRSVIAALTTAVIAVLISYIGLGNVPMYHIPSLTIDTSLAIWSIVMGPIFGACAYGFISVATKARAKALHNYKMIVLCLVNFTVIGLLAIYFPALLGNGKSPVQLEFAYPLGIGLSAVLLILRVVITWSSLGAGAQGGLLTPSLANGALLGVMSGGLWCLLWPNTPLEAFAIVGATAFLAAAQKMPLTAIILIFEFTRMNLSFLIPIMLAVAGAVTAARLSEPRL